MEYPFSAHACVYFPEICISPLAEKGPEDGAELLGGWNLDSGNGAQVAAGKNTTTELGEGGGGKSRVKRRVREEMKKIKTFI